MIALKQVCKAFGQEVIFDDLNLEIETCGIHVIEGPSGSGKSTLLHLIMGFEQPDQGDIQVDGQPVIIFQNYELLTELSVKENLLLGRDEGELDMDLVRYFEMEDLLSRRIDELSGGQRQRVGIIRALSFHPSIILCDEPTESLDVHNKHLVMSLLKQYARKATILLVSHDHEMVKAYGDVFYVLADHRIYLKEQSESKLPRLDEGIHFIFEKSAMKHILTTLTERKEKMIILIRTILFLLLGGMLIVVNVWLRVPETTRATNANYMYVELKENNELIPTAYFDTPMRRVCMKFQSAYYQDRYYDIGIYPSIDMEEGVYLNQNAMEQMDGISIGDSLILYYLVDGIEYPYEVTVDGVIEDTDLNEALIYYDAVDFESYLQTIPYTSLTDDRLTNQYDYLQKEKPWIEFEVPYEDQKEIAEAAREDIRLVIHAPLYEQRQAFMEETGIYHVLYLLLEIVLFGVLVILDWIVFRRNLKKVKDSLAVLTSQGMSLSYLKRCYLIRQCQWISLSWLVVTVGLLIMADLTHMAGDLIMLPLALWTVYTLIGILYVEWRIHQISTGEMSWILKDRWD